MLWRNHGEFANSFAAEIFPKTAARCPLLYSQVASLRNSEMLAKENLGLRLDEAWWRLQTISGPEQGKRQRWGG